MANKFWGDSARIEKLEARVAELEKPSIMAALNRLEQQLTKLILIVTKAKGDMDRAAEQRVIADVNDLKNTLAGEPAGKEKT